MSKLTKALTAAAGNAGGGTLGYVEDVFSTYLYEGTGSAQTITNGIDLDGEGGMVWIKERSTSGSDNHVSDTERGIKNPIQTDSTAAENSYYFNNNLGITSFNNNGFTVASGSNFNDAGTTTVSWTFRKAEKFFDVVTYTGNGNSGYRQISHNLGSTPAAVILKNTTAAASWYVYHKDTAQPGDTDYATHGAYLNLNSTAAKNFSNSAFPKVGTSSGGVTAVYDSSVFTIGEDLNESGKNYVLYLFASDAGGFGDDGDENIIKCGSYTGSASEVSVDLGFEPQWLLIKSVDQPADWYLADSMRSMTADPYTDFLYPNLSSGESGLSNGVMTTSTGFIADSGGGYPINHATSSYIYIAIRRPMKTPESGTEVFKSVARTGTGAAVDVSGVGFAPDLATIKTRNTNYGYGHEMYERLTGAKIWKDSASTSAEAAATQQITSFNMDGVSLGTSGGTGRANYASATYIDHYFKRATGFFDVVAYTGDDVSTRTVAHNLGVTPEFIIVKRRDGTGNWVVYHEGTSANPEQNYLFLNGANQVASSIAYWNYTAPTDTHFAVRSHNDVNGIIGGTYIAYLFATLAGVSKVGSYTGNGTTQNIDCGFSGGARFVLIKRTDDSESWHVFDTERGIVSGDDPALRLDSTVAEFSSAAINPYSAGFQVEQSASCNNNVNGGSYIFLAIA